MKMCLFVSVIQFYLLEIRTCSTKRNMIMRDDKGCFYAISFINQIPFKYMFMFELQIII